uniref:C3H1-type domain-containing protein n=1 Tax=Noctiluca scintillans TaxID=2966 RepID=A0A7S1A2E3_NOCSC|mmetsp:Transcript_29144/g.76986  ORF Transcript_29144/g.76986 Transcript_29144/m.76986 type:complete len:156 (+) Transcript_29144:65-532(+)
MADGFQDPNHVVWGAVETNDGSSSSLLRGGYTETTFINDTSGSSIMERIVGAPASNDEVAELQNEIEAKHAEGTCQPCTFFHTKTGCLAGTACRHCHLAHSRKTRTKPNKDRRHRQKRFAEAFANAKENDAGCEDEDDARDEEPRKPKPKTVIRL